MKKQWKTLSHKTVLNSPIMRVEQKIAVNPRNDKECEFTTAHFPNWVNVIALTPEKEIILIRQFRHGTDIYEVETPGGCIDDTDKNPVEAGVRELLEETGYAGENARLIGQVSPNPAMQGNICFFVLVENAKLTSAQILDHGEDIEVFKVPYEEVHELIP